MFHPPTHIRARTEYNISTRTLIALSCFGLDEIYQISNSTKTSVNKRLLLCHRFFTLSVPAVLFFGAKLHKKNDIRKGFGKKTSRVAIFGAFCESVLSRSSVGCESVIGRWGDGG